jgi:hypothetical protein
MTARVYRFPGAWEWEWEPACPCGDDDCPFPEPGYVTRDPRAVAQALANLSPDQRAALGLPAAGEA